MTPENLRKGVRARKGEPLQLSGEEEERAYKHAKDFWFFTGLPAKFLVELPDEELMELWARFVMERIEDLSC